LGDRHTTVDRGTPQFEVRRGSRHWEVRDLGSRQLVATGGLREEALLQARRLLRASGGEIVMIHGETGERWKVERVRARQVEAPQRLLVPAVARPPALTRTR
jgi:hypothetical protein